MPQIESKCIYCEAAIDPSAGEGEHIVPRALGDFGSENVLRRICPKCNNAMSPLEEELVRSAPEAVYRRHATCSEDRRGKKVGWRPSATAPSPQFMAVHDDHDELVEIDPDAPTNAHPIDQLVAVLKNGESRQVRLFPKMNADAVKRSLRRQEIRNDDIERVYWHAYSAHADQYIPVLRQVWPTATFEELPTTEAGSHRCKSRVICRYTNHYYRAITKLAFHYFLKHSRHDFYGDEQYFEPVRSFIQHGGDPQDFVGRDQRALWTPFGREVDGQILTSADWLHVLCCFESLHQVVVSLHTFVGPLRVPEPRFITLLARNSPVLSREFCYGHKYVYPPKESTSIVKGRVLPVRLHSTGSEWRN